MIRVEDRVSIRGSALDAFRYLADFTNLPEWDPGISRVRRLDTGPLRVGSRFEVVALVLGRDMPMSYEVVVLDETAHRAELIGTAPGLRATDRITLSPRGAGAEVHWQADFELLGARRLAEPLMHPFFARLARKAMAGLAARLG